MNAEEPSILDLPISLRVLRKFSFPRKLGILEKLYGAYLAKYGVQWVECWNQIIWKLDLADACHRWIVFGQYEGGEGLNLAKKCLRSGGVFVDSGSNIGQWLLYIGNLSNVKTYAFEPVSTQREWLTECLEKQQNWPVTVIASGLGSERTQMEIQCDGARSTLNLDWYQGRNLDRELIEICRLDQILNEQSIDEVKFWKLDVEGAELAALQGAEKYLEEQKIETIYFECHPNSYQNICQLLLRYGYQISYLHNGKLIPKTDKRISNTQDLVATIVS